MRMKNKGILPGRLLPACSAVWPLRAVRPRSAAASELKFVVFLLGLGFRVWGFIEFKEVQRSAATLPEHSHIDSPHVIPVGF